MFRGNIAVSLLLVTVMINASQAQTFGLVGDEGQISIVSQDELQIASLLLFSADGYLEPIPVGEPIEPFSLLLENTSHRVWLVRLGSLIDIGTELPTNVRYLPPADQVSPLGDLFARITGTGAVPASDFPVCGSRLECIPEPSSLTMCCFIALAWLTGRRRRG